MSKKGQSKIAPPLRLKRPQDYIIEYPQDYKPPKPKPDKPNRPPKQPKTQKQSQTKSLISRIPRPPKSHANSKLEQKRKHYLPGQKYTTPDQDDGLRIFYQSLLTQKPESELALKYCLEHGLMERDVAEGILQCETQKRLNKKTEKS